FSWRATFLIGVPIMALLLAIGPVLLPEFRDPNARRVDIASVALSLASVLLVIFGVKQIALGNAYIVAAITIAVGIAQGTAFVRRQRSVAEPVIDPTLFAKPALTASLVAYA